MKIEGVFRRDKVSVRTRNLCKYHEIKYMRDLQLHYHKYGGFKNLRYCGGKCNEELIAIYYKYSNVYVKDEKKQSASAKKGKRKLDDVVTDLDEVIRVTRDITLEGLEQKLSDHWEKKDIGSAESKPKVCLASKSPEEIEQMLQDHWEKKGVRSVQKKPEVSKVAASLEELEQRLEEHWKQPSVSSKTIEPKVSKTPKSPEEIEQMLQDHWEKKSVRSVKSKPKVSKTPKSLEEIEQMLQDHWKESK